MYFYICKFTNGQLESVEFRGSSELGANGAKVSLEGMNPDSIYELRASDIFYERGNPNEVYEALNQYANRHYLKECKEAHKIGDLIPQFNNVEMADQTCNCGKILYVLEDCGCPANQHKELHAKENPNYKG